jgi:hypothetical protein
VSAGKIVASDGQSRRDARAGTRALTAVPTGLGVASAPEGVRRTV